MRARPLILWGLLAGCYAPERTECQVRCSDTGTCPWGMTCSAGRCASVGQTCESAHAPKQPAVAACSSADRPRCRSAREIEACGDEGAWEVQMTCGDAAVCSDGACVECSPGLAECTTDQAFRSCSEAGEWLSSVACPPERPLCKLGACVSELQVTAGGAHACALDHAGRVPNLRCWGAGAHGELGQGDRENRGDNEQRPPAPVDLEAAADSVVAGGSHTCAILDGGKVKCWGDNGAGQLGLGDTHARGDDPGELEALPFVDLGDTPAVALSLGTRHSCALLENGVIKCWGDNSDGQLGLSDTEARGDDPGEMGVLLPGFARGRGSALSVSAGAGMTCALYIDGSLLCRGGWEFLLTDISAPRTLEGGAGVAVGEHHACTWSSVDELVCTGLNYSGQLGRDPTSPGSGVDLGSGFRAERVSTGANHSCGVANGRAKCWGLNLFGALGIGTTESARGDAKQGAPGEMGDMLPLLELGNEGETPLFVNDVSAGNNFTCAVLGDKQVKCWGANHSGQLGLGHTEHRGDQSEHMGDALGRVWIETESE